jgi:hypothetical protein
MSHQAHVQPAIPQRESRHRVPGHASRNRSRHPSVSHNKKAPINTTRCLPPLSIHMQVFQLAKFVVNYPDVFTLGTPRKDETQRQHFHLLAQVSKRSGYPAFASFQQFCRGPRASEIYPVELHMEPQRLAYQARRGNLLHHDKHGVVLAFVAERGSVEVW